MRRRTDTCDDSAGFGRVRIQLHCTLIVQNYKILLLNYMRLLKLKAKVAD
jgi:hypothetical protein